MEQEMMGKLYLRIVELDKQIVELQKKLDQTHVVDYLDRKYIKNDLRDLQKLKDLAEALYYGTGTLQ